MPGVLRTQEKKMKQTQVDNLVKHLVWFVHLKSFRHLKQDERPARTLPTHGDTLSGL